MRPSLKADPCSPPSPINHTISNAGFPVTAEKALDFPIANMPLYSDISGTETGKCTDCTKLQQTVALIETRLAALEKCKGLRIQCRWNRFLPLQESTNAPATHAPLSPEMRPDGQCGQRRNMNQSPWRRAAHASATCAPLTPEMCPDRRAQVEKKRDYSLPHTSTLPLSDTQIADSPQTLKRDNSPPDAINTVPSPIADAGLTRNGHPPPLHYRPKTLKRDNSLPDTMDTVPSPIADAGLARNGHPPPHLSHSHNNNSSSTVSSLCNFPAEFKKLEYVGIKLASVSMIASPGHAHMLITPKRRAPQPPPCTDSSPEYY
ncbi:unnamed protein product [Boreogadus saida]